MTSPAYPVVYWLNAGTTSNVADLGHSQIVGFVTPATLSSSTLTFNAATTINGTLKAVKDSSGSAISFTVAANGYYGFTEDQKMKFEGIRYLQLVGGSSEAQGRNVELALIPRPSI